MVPTRSPKISKSAYKSRTRCVAHEGLRGFPGDAVRRMRRNHCSDILGEMGERVHRHIVNSSCVDILKGERDMVKAISATKPQFWIDDGSQHGAIASEDCAHAFLLQRSRVNRHKGALRSATPKMEPAKTLILPSAFRVAPSQSSASGSNKRPYDGPHRGAKRPYDGPHCQAAPRSPRDPSPTPPPRRRQQDGLLPLPIVVKFLILARSELGPCCPGPYPPPHMGLQLLNESVSKWSYLVC